MDTSNEPFVAICLLTYNRLDYARKTLVSTLNNVQSSNKLHVHIASDGDTQEYVETLQGDALNERVVGRVTVSNSEQRGYGTNFNRATQVIHQLPGIRYVLVLEDDWELLRPLDLDRMVAALDSDESLGCMRLGYLGFTQDIHMVIKHVNGWDDDGGITCGVLLPSSPEPHVFAGHPRLEKVSWEKSVGAWPEIEMVSDPAGTGGMVPSGRRLNPGETEYAVSKMEASRRGVVWPFTLMGGHGGGLHDSYFAHIGTNRSW